MGSGRELDLAKSGSSERLGSVAYRVIRGSHFHGWKLETAKVRDPCSLLRGELRARCAGV